MNNKLGVDEKSRGEMIGGSKHSRTGRTKVLVLRNHRSISNKATPHQPARELRMINFKCEEAY